MAEPLSDLRDLAVQVVDARYGYTAEYAPNPDAHREEYDYEEARLRQLALDEEEQR